MARLNCKHAVLPLLPGVLVVWLRNVGIYNARKPATETRRSFQRAMIITVSDYSLENRTIYPRLSHALDRLDLLVVNHVVINDYSWIQVRLLLLERCDFQEGNSTVDVTALEIPPHLWRNRYFTAT